MTPKPIHHMELRGALRQLLNNEAKPTAPELHALYSRARLPDSQLHQEVVVQLGFALSRAERWESDWRVREHLEVAFHALFDYFPIHSAEVEAVLEAAAQRAHEAVMAVYGDAQRATRVAIAVRTTPTPEKPPAPQPGEGMLEAFMAKLVRSVQHDAEDYFEGYTGPVFSGSFNPFAQALAAVQDVEAAKDKPFYLSPRSASSSPTAPTTQSTRVDCTGVEALRVAEAVREACYEVAESLAAGWDESAEREVARGRPKALENSTIRAAAQRDVARSIRSLNLDAALAELQKA